MPHCGEGAAGRFEALDRPGRSMIQALSSAPPSSAASSGAPRDYALKFILKIFALLPRHESMRAV